MTTETAQKLRGLRHNDVVRRIGLACFTLKIHGGVKLHRRSRVNDIATVNNRVDMDRWTNAGLSTGASSSGGSSSSSGSMFSGESLTQKCSSSRRSLDPLDLRSFPQENSPVFFCNHSTRYPQSL
ncbi:hypothetical protein ACLB2K_054352 [Fragaria x ananassa]